MKSKTNFRVLLAVCFCHAINDMLQSLLGATYPNLKATYHLTFTQIGFVAFAYQITASLLQPLVGLGVDRESMPFSLPGGTPFTFAGLLVLCAARGYGTLIGGACILGVGSSGSLGGALRPVGAAVVVEQ